MRRLFAALLACALLAGCGDSDGGDAASATPGAPEKRELTVGVLPLADLAPFYIAIEDGLFEREGLKVTPKVASGGAQLITQAVAGDLDLAFSNYVSILQAADKGLPLRILRENNRAGPQGIYSAPDSAIHRPADLAGKTIAVNSLKNIQELTARAVLDARGVDPESLKFTEVPPPEMQDVLARGNVDAAWFVEPFRTQADAAGFHRIVGAFEGPTENLPVAGWTATEQWIRENPHTAAAFVRAMDAAMKKAASDPDAIAKTIPTYTKIPPAVARKLPQPGLTERNELGDLGKLQDLMIQYGIVEKGVDVDEVAVTPDELPQQ